MNARGAAPLVFEVLLQNSRLSPREEPQSFRVVLHILGDGLIVEERTLRVVVPAGVLPVRTRRRRVVGTAPRERSAFARARGHMLASRP